MSEKDASLRFDWIDLTVEDAHAVKDFYSQVVGWTTSEMSMGDYADYCVHDAEGNVVGGICHARGENSSIPPVWMPYVTIRDIDVSLAKVRELGGEQVGDVRGAGDSKFCVIKDPAGAHLVLFQK